MELDSQRNTRKTIKFCKVFLFYFGKTLLVADRGREKKGEKKSISASGLLLAAGGSGGYSV